MRTATLVISTLVVAATLSRPSLAADNAKEQAELRKTTLKYAACVVKRHHVQASEAILATAGNDEIMKKFSEIIDSDCLDTVTGGGIYIRFPTDTYQYSLADALVNADFAAHGETSFASRLPLAQPAFLSVDDQTAYLAKTKSGRKRKEMSEDFGKQNARTWLSRYGECVVREDPINTRYWLLTPPETPEETSRIKALQSVFGICLGEGTLKFNRISMRGTVAINYYRLAMATPQPSTGKSQ